MTFLDSTRLSSQQIRIRDMILSCHIGLSEQERKKKQRLRLDVTLTLAPQPTLKDDITETVNYGDLVKKVRSVVSDNSVKLLETMADFIAEECFFDERVLSVKIHVEKPDRYADIAGVGITMQRDRHTT